MTNSLEKKNRILEEAYKQLSSKGIEATKIEDIASALKMSKKTIYLLFRTKEEIVLQTGIWKIQHISRRAQEVVDKEISVIDKFIMYLEICYFDLKDVTLKMIYNLISNRSKAEEMMTDYLQEAVFVRFTKLFEQAEKEGFMKENTDPKSTLMMYWETMSTFLFARPVKSFSGMIDSKVSLNELVGNQFKNFFRGFLNEKGIEKFDVTLKSHPTLSNVFA